MPPPVGHDGTLQEIRARAPQGITSPFDDPPPSQTPGDNSNAERTVVKYSMLIMALFVASFVFFRYWMIYQRRRNREERGVRRLTRGIAHRVRYPFDDDDFVAMPLSTAHDNSRRTHANDIDLEGRRFTTPAVVEVDHDGLLRGMGVLPRYESIGGPPNYAELVNTGNVTLSNPEPLPPPPAAIAQSPRNNTTQPTTFRSFVTKNANSTNPFRSP